MSINSRHEEILRILEERTFITVNELAERTFTSTSSIRRDLTYLQNNGLVIRTHGGVSLPITTNQVASFHDRSRKNIKQKRLIAQKASSLLHDGQSILLDSSSTSTFLLPYIAKLNAVSVFTNNLATALQSIELGIDTYCLGGHAINHTGIVASADTYRVLSELRVDALFFSSQSLAEDGNISDSTEEENYVRKLMLQAAKESIFLCDSDKFGNTSLHRLCNLDAVSFAVFDREYPQLKTTCKIL